MDEIDYDPIEVAELQKELQEETGRPISIPKVIQEWSRRRDLAREQENTPKIEPSREDSSNLKKKTIILAYANGVLPSMISAELDLDKDFVDGVILTSGEEIKRVSEICTVDYQIIRANSILDKCITRVEDIIFKGSSDKDVLTASKEIINLIKSGDLEKMFKAEVMDASYEDIPDEVDKIDEEIEAEMAKAKKLGLI